MKELFEKAGIDCLPYAKAPSGSGVFVIGLNQSRDIVRYWLPENNDNLEIKNKRFSKKYGQVSFSAVEPKRVLIHTAKGFRHYKQERQVFSEWSLRGAFNVALPMDTKYEATKHSKVRSDEYYDFYDLTIKATVPASNQHFLVGYDESKLFISALPKAADSIEDAHKILRPKGAGPSTPRQGEWFFLKSDIEQDILDQKCVNQLLRNQYRDFNGHFAIDSDRWSTSNHRATMIVRTGGKVYVKGVVFDTTGRHHNLNFDEWMLVARNKEIVLSRASGVRWD